MCIQYSNFVFLIFCSFVTGLYAKGNATVDQIQRTVEASATLHKTSMSHVSQLINNVVNALPKDVADGTPAIKNLLDYAQSSADMYVDLETERRRRNLLTNRGLVLPTSYKVGTRINVSADGSTQEVEVNAQYISIIDTLTNIKTTRHCSVNQTELLNDYEDTDTFKNSNYFQKHPSAHRLTLYHDDIECGNNLGSRAGINKMTMFYMSVNKDASNTETKGKLTAIHLVLVCYASDISSYGYGAILRPLIDDLIKLDRGVIQIDKDRTPHQLNARLEHVVGDNLAANQILGFIASFSKGFFCRFCYISGNDSGTATTTLSAPSRTPYSHQIDMETALVEPNHYKKTGVKERCVLEELSYFSTTISTVPDIM